jgi:hypothetical protein
VVRRRRVLKPLLDVGSHIRLRFVVSPKVISLPLCL